MIWSNKIFEDLQKQIPKDLYERLINRKKILFEEDENIKENMIRKLFKVESDENLAIIMKRIEPFLRNQKRDMLISRGNYEEVNEETKPSVKSMTFMEHNKENETKEIGGEIPTMPIPIAVVETENDTKMKEAIKL